MAQIVSGDWEWGALQAIFKAGFAEIYLLKWAYAGKKSRMSHTSFLEQEIKHHAQWHPFFADLHL